MIDVTRAELMFSICRIVLSILAQSQRKQNRWIHIKNANPGVYKNVVNESDLIDLFRAGLMFSVCAVAASIPVALLRKQNRWIRIKNPNPMNVFA